LIPRLEMEVLGVGTIGEIDNAFASLAQKRTEALFVAPAGPICRRNPGSMLYLYSAVE